MGRTRALTFEYKLSIINDTHREKLRCSVQYKNGWLAASDLFDVFTQSIKFHYTFYTRIKSTYVWKMRFIK